MDEIVRAGARQMLAAALQAEVSAYVESFADEVDEHGRRSPLPVGVVDGPGAATDADDYPESPDQQEVP